jgi:hypothetical protein
MPLWREGIEDVRPIALPDAVAGNGRSTAFSRVALVRWRSSRKGKLHQVYVNRCLAGATVDPAQRRMVVSVPSSFESAVQIEVVAVEPSEGHIDFAHAIFSSSLCSSRAKLTLLRSQTLSTAATANIYCDNGTGTVDYGAPLTQLPIPLWPCRQDKAGFGMTGFGTGDFGYDAAAAIGFGKGTFGRGQFGLDADRIEWISPALPLGRYRLGVKVTDDRGSESLASETTAMTIVPAGRPAAGLDIVTYEKQTGELALRIEDRA